MSLTLHTVTVDCVHAAQLARFWSAALGVAPDEGGSEYFTSLPAAGGAPGMFFIMVPEAKSGKNRVHVDLVADDRAAEVARLQELGAAHLGDKDEWGHRWTVLADPEGNEFCVGQRPDTPDAER